MTILETIVFAAVATAVMVPVASVLLVWLTVGHSPREQWPVWKLVLRSFWP